MRHLRVRHVDVVIVLLGAATLVLAFWLDRGFSAPADRSPPVTAAQDVRLREQLVAGLRQREQQLNSGRGFLTMLTYRAEQQLNEDRAKPQAMQRGQATLDQVRYAFSGELYKEQRHQVYPQPPRRGAGGESWRDACKGFDGHQQYDWDPYRGNAFVFEARRGCDAETVLLLKDAGHLFSQVLQKAEVSVIGTGGIVNGSNTVEVLYHPPDRPSHWAWWFVPDRGYALIRTEFENGPPAANDEAVWLRRVFSVERYRECPDGVWIAQTCTQKWYEMRRGEKPLHLRTIWFQVGELEVNPTIPRGYFLFDLPVGVRVKHLGGPGEAKRVGGSIDELAEAVARGMYPPGVAE